MQLDLPTIYAAEPVDSRMEAVARGWSVFFATALLAILITAASIPPSPAGTGSHTRLGLSRCTFMDRTGIPCPSCGMTTSFAWLVRGNVLASAYTQPMGCLLAILAAAGVVGGFYEGLTARPVHRLLRLVPSGIFLWPLFTVAIAGWAWKIGIHLLHLDGWPRPG